MSSLVDNIAKVKAAHAAIGEAISAKGVAVPGGTRLSGYPDLIAAIEQGGGGAETIRAEAETGFLFVETEKIVY